MNKKIPVYEITVEDVEKIEIISKDIENLFWRGSTDDSLNGFYNRIIQENIRKDRDQKLSDLGID